MDKVVITKSKVDSLADKIRAKAGTSGNMTIDQMGNVMDDLDTLQMFNIYKDRPGIVATLDLFPVVITT